MKNKRFHVYGKFVPARYAGDILAIFLLFALSGGLLFGLGRSGSYAIFLLSGLFSICAIAQIIRIYRVATKSFILREDGFYRGSHRLFAYSEIRGMVITTMEKPLSMTHDPLTLDGRLLKANGELLIGVCLLRTDNAKDVLLRLHHIYGEWDKNWSYRYSNEKVKSALGKDFLFDFLYNRQVLDRVLKQFSGPMIVQPQVIKSFTHPLHPHCHLILDGLPEDVDESGEDMETKV